jgi:hypothetical protein
VFEFAGEFYLQVNGTAMGTKLAPAYANIFMAYIEKEMQALVDPDTIILWCRFIDDIFVIWNDTKEAFVQFVEKCNKLHKTIKMTHQISELEMIFFRYYNIQRSTILQKWSFRLQDISEANQRVAICPC